MKKPLHRETYLVTVTRPVNSTQAEVKKFIAEAVAGHKQPISLRSIGGIELSPVKVRKQQDDPRVARGNALKKLREAASHEGKEAKQLMMSALSSFLHSTGEKEIAGYVDHIRFFSE